MKLRIERQAKKCKVCGKVLGSHNKSLLCTYHLNCIFQRKNKVHRKQK